MGCAALPAPGSSEAGPREPGRRPGTHALSSRRPAGGSPPCEASKAVFLNPAPLPLLLPESQGARARGVPLLRATRTGTPEKVAGRLRVGCSPGGPPAAPRRPRPSARPASLTAAASPSPAAAATMSAETASGPTQDQVEILEYNFNKVNRHPDPTTLLLIAAEAGLSEEETQKWFKQRLAQWRKSEGLPSESRSVTD